jgi:hypothetical protein
LAYDRRRDDELLLVEVPRGDPGTPRHFHSGPILGQPMLTVADEADVERRRAAA